MSVLIRGMEMPESCFECPVSRPAMGNLRGAVIGCPLIGRTISALFYEQKRMQDCPLVPVPKHGRLIDADKVQEEWFQLNFDRKISDGTLAYWNFLLSEAQTVIPAEEGE